MPTDIRMKKAVPIDAFAPGYFMRFSMNDLAHLGRLFEQSDGAWIENFESRLRNVDVKAIQSAMRIGVKDPNGQRLKDFPFDDLHISPLEITGAISDALTCALTGQSYADLCAARAAEQAAAAQAAADQAAADADQAAA